MNLTETKRIRTKAIMTWTRNHVDDTNVDMVSKMNFNAGHSTYRLVTWKYTAVQYIFIMVSKINDGRSNVAVGVIDHAFNGPTDGEFETVFSFEIDLPVNMATGVAIRMMTEPED